MKKAIICIEWIFFDVTECTLLNRHSTLRGSGGGSCILVYSAISGGIHNFTFFSRGIALNFKKSIFHYHEFRYQH